MISSSYLPDSSNLYDSSYLSDGECSNRSVLTSSMSGASTSQGLDDKDISLIDSCMAKYSGMSLEDHDFYIKNFDLSLINPPQGTNKESNESINIGNKSLEKSHTSNFTEKKFIPPSNNFIKNVVKIKEELVYNRRNDGKKFNKDNIMHYNLLILKMQTQNEFYKNAYPDDTDVMKSINEIILKKYPFVVKLAKKVNLNFKNDINNRNRTSFHKKLKFIDFFIKNIIKVSFSDEVIKNINYRKYICLEVNKFIDRYKYLPEVLNMKMFLFTKNHVPENNVIMYVLIRMMNISLTQNDDENIHNTLAVLYHSVLQSVNNTKMITRSYLSHEYVSDSIIGITLLSIDLLSRKQKPVFSYRITHTKVTKIKSIMLRNKTSTFNLFLIVNLHLFVKCIEEETKGEFGNYNSGNSIIFNQLEVLEKLFKEYFSNYSKYSNESILNCSLLIYNYLMYGNNHE